MVLGAKKVVQKWFGADRISTNIFPNFSNGLGRAQIAYAFLSDHQ